VLQKRLRELSFLNSGVKIDPDRRTRRSPGDLPSRGWHPGIRAVPESKQNFYSRNNFPGFVERRTAWASSSRWQWNDSYAETMYCFTNKSRKRTGARTSPVPRGADAHAQPNYIEQETAGKKDSAHFGDDSRRSLTAVLSVKRGPEFSRRNKDKLVSSEGQGYRVRPPPRCGKAGQFPVENPAQAKSDRQPRSSTRRRAVKRRASAELTRRRRARHAGRQQLPTARKGIPRCAIFIVEGDSEVARPSRVATAHPDDLPLKGRSLNVERAPRRTRSSSRKWAR